MMAFTRCIVVLSCCCSLVTCDSGSSDGQGPVVTPDTTPGKKTVTISRGTFSVRDLGNTTSGMPVIMLHGWPESSYTWVGVASHLDPGLRVIAPDLRGLGDSERTLDVKAYRKVELAKDVIAVADALGVGSFYLVGHDWGGIVAQEVAFLVPERVKKLVIMNIPILTNTAAAQETTAYMNSVRYTPFWYQYFQQQEGLPEAMIKGNEEVWVKHFFGTKVADGLIPAATVDEFVRAYKIPNTPATGASYYRTMLDDALHWMTLAGKKFTMPSLYILGTQDTVIIPANATHLEDCFNSITVEKLDAAHFVQDEKPKEVAELLNRFFAK